MITALGKVSRSDFNIPPFVFVIIGGGEEEDQLTY